jgi:hypothetical protein
LILLKKNSGFGLHQTNNRGYLKDLEPDIDKINKVGPGFSLSSSIFVEREKGR